MVKATHMSKEKVAWGEVEVFHAVEYKGEYFRIYESVTLTTTDTESFSGEIVNVTQSSLDFMTKNRHFKSFNLSKIASIHYS